MPTEKSLSQSSFGSTKSGELVSRFTCTNVNGYSVDLINYGATVVAFNAPDRQGEYANITLGCGDMAGYEANESFLGATVGRYANRIGEGKFSIDEKTYKDLTANSGKRKRLRPLTRLVSDSRPAARTEKTATPAKSWSPWITF